MFACNHQYSYTAHFRWQQCFAIKIEEAFLHHQNHSYDLHEGESSGIASVDVLHREAVTPSFIMKIIWASTSRKGQKMALTTIV